MGSNITEYPSTKLFLTRHPLKNEAYLCICKFVNGYNRTHFENIMAYLRNDCRNAELYYQMVISLSSTSCLLKLPRVPFG